MTKYKEPWCIMCLERHPEGTKMITFEREGWNCPDGTAHKFYVCEFGKKRMNLEDNGYDADA